MRITLLGVVSCILVITAPLQARERWQGLRTLSARRIHGVTPVIDGRLDEAAWQGAATASGFTQNTPNGGAAATERTEARVLFDDDAIYIGMWMYDQHPDSIRRQLNRRDQSAGASDEVAVLIDSYHDRRTAFVFRLAASGTKTDLMRFDDAAGFDDGWDAVWSGAVSADSVGWYAEYRIPLSQLRFGNRDSSAAGADYVWGINFWRFIQRRNEVSYWAQTLPQDPGFVSQFGELRDLEGLHPRRGAEIMPYGMSRVTRADGDAQDPFFRKTDPFGGAGVDIKYPVTSGLTLSATVNPDFGQVEADPSVVNLTAFESFFPERRPFFVEGANLFQFPVGLGGMGGSGSEQLFYPRRIGRTPQRSVSSDGGYVSAPSAATILGAAKLSGRTSGWSLALLDAATAREEALVSDSTGERSSAQVEPLTNYLVARASRDFHGGRTVIGSAFTATNRDLSDSALASELRSAAYTGGVDVSHKFGQGHYQARAWLAGSEMLGTDSAIAALQRSPAHLFQRPGASYLRYNPARTSLAGFGGDWSVGKIGGGHWYWGLEGNTRSPGFEANDIGFMGSADLVQTSSYVIYYHFEPGKRIRSWDVDLFQNASWDFGGDRQAAGLTAAGSVILTNQWGVSLSAVRTLPAMSVSVLRGGPALRTPGGKTLNLFTFSDGRRRISANLFGSVTVGDEPDDRAANLSLTVKLRPSSRLDLSLNPAVSRNQSGWQYIDQPTGLGATRYVVGHLSQATASLTARISYLFSRDLSLQFYAQPFASAGAYDRLYQVSDPRASAFGSRFHAFTGTEISYDSSAAAYHIDLDRDGTSDFSLDNPDFDFRQLRSNLILRWEYRPGSVLFVVWTHGRTTSDTDAPLQLGRDLRRLFSAPATNVFLVKLSYWLQR